MLYFKWILSVKLRNERDIKLTVAVYFPAEYHVECVKGPENGREQGRFLLLLMAVVSPSLSFLLFVPTQRSD